MLFVRMDMIGCLLTRPQVSHKGQGDNARGREMGNVKLLPLCFRGSTVGRIHDLIRPNYPISCNMSTLLKVSNE